MTELEQLKQIIADAPEGATHVSHDIFFHKEDGYVYYEYDAYKDVWRPYPRFTLTRSLADIKRIIELLEKN